MNNRLLLVFFVSKRQLVRAYKKKKKSLKKAPKRGQTPNLLRLVVAVDDERGQNMSLFSTLL